MNALGSEFIAVAAGVITAILLRWRLGEYLVSPLMESIYILAILAILILSFSRHDVSKEHSRAVTKLIKEQYEIGHATNSVDP